MDRLETLRVFLAVADAKGFASAARRLGMSPPAVTRAVAALEERIGAQLLHRTTRVVRLTEAGMRFSAECRHILASLEEAENAAAGSQAEPRGQLAVTASLTFGRMFVGPLLIDFLAQHPKVTARTLFVDRIVDLVDEGVDVAVRIAHLPDSSLSAVRVGSVRRVVCAAPAYLRARGTPRAPADLASHDVIDFSTAADAPVWSFGAEAKGRGRGHAQSITVHPPARLVVNTSDVAVAAAVAGHGITRGLSYVIEPEVRAGRLRLLLADHEPPPIPIQVVHAGGRNAPAKIRAFVDFLVERLRAMKIV